MTSARPVRIGWRAPPMPAVRAPRRRQTLAGNGLHCPPAARLRPPAARRLSWSAPVGGARSTGDPAEIHIPAIGDTRHRWPARM
ncbi:hypothetical protein FMEAI12_6500054 [Parafrankia sp. Ea1.12]|nr:hypothetical protein FMEAI12_6500054 [Parafrankia sp. Ea1.12]